MKSKKILLVGILLLGIGFATASAAFIMTGNVKIATNDADFDVRFIRTSVDVPVNGTAAISGDGKSITFVAGPSEYAAGLVNVGEVSTLDFVVKNNSDMYDADVSIECGSTGSKSDYFQITEEVATPINAKETGAGKVKVTLVKPSLEDFSETFTCNLVAKAKERTSVPTVYVCSEGETTDYTTFSKDAFIKEVGAQRSVCINRNGNLFCLKNNNYADSVEKLNEEFGEANCGPASSSASGIACSYDGFMCRAYSDGAVECYGRHSNLVILMPDNSIDY